MNKKEIVEAIITAFRHKKKVMICGNGGSATMAQHFAGEFVGKYLHDRYPLPAISLTSETSTITAIANDYGYDQIFSRQIQALGTNGDILIVLSTSGTSNNCLIAMQTATKLGIYVIDFPRIGSSTPEIQENQFRLMHAVCKEVEEAFI